MVSKEFSNDEKTLNNSKKVIKEHVKTDFYETDEKLSLSLFIKDIDSNPDHIRTEFTETNCFIRFKTKDKNFLRLHGIDNENEAQFEWNIEFYDRVESDLCDYKINKSKMEIILKKKQNGEKWLTPFKRMRTEAPVEAKPEIKHRNSSTSSSPSPAPVKITVEPKKPISNCYGQVGLVNLGNTCYMNAAIQFLINATDFRDYFLITSQTFQKEINTNNALGLNGKMAVQFAMLVRQLWNSNMSHLVPNRLRDLICVKYTNFRGYEQHDTQEFMCSLLSLIHEDLNRVLKKPFYESCLECEDDSLEKCVKTSEESWKRFLSREDSVIVDNFYGQFKSKLTCPECHKVSITFEPFNNLLIPLAKPKKEINFILNSNDKLILSNVLLNETDSVEDFLNKVKFSSNDLSSKNLGLYVIEKHESEDNNNQEITAGFKFDSYFDGLLDKKQKIAEIGTNKLFLINEMPSLNDDVENDDSIVEFKIEQFCKYPILNDPNQCSFCMKISDDESKKLPRCTRCYRSAYCNSDCQKQDWPKHNSKLCQKEPDQIGLPFIISFKKSLILSATFFDDYLRKSILNKSLKSVELINFDLNKKNIFELELYIDKKFKKLDSKCTDLLDMLQNKKKLDSFKIRLKWNNFNQANVKTDLEKLSDMRSDFDGHKVDLYDCLKLFTQAEKLTSDNPWYCSKCKKHQEALKQMNLWKLPKYLIITLKRFQATKAADNYLNSHDEATRQMMLNSRFGYLLQNRVVYNKLNTFIDFPLQGLNMSKYLIETSKEKENIYDLCGVINHLGQSISIGHYTACARTHDRLDSTKDELGWRVFDDQQVYPVRHESQIISKDAYVLMYRLRSRPSINTSEQHFSSSSENEFYDVESEESESENENKYTNLNEID